MPLSFQVFGGENFVGILRFDLNLKLVFGDFFIWTAFVFVGEF